MLAVVLAAASCMGCMGAAHVRGGASGIEGAGVSAEGPVSKLRLGLEATYERARHTSDSERHSLLAYDGTVRIGLASLIRESWCEDCVEMPWVDFGPAAGLGLALTHETDVIGHAFAGAWLDVRLSSAESHPVLRIAVERDTYSSASVGGTQLIIGIGFINWDLPR